MHLFLHSSRRIAATMPLITMANDNNDMDAQIDNLCEVHERAPPAPPRRRALRFPEPDAAGSPQPRAATVIMVD